MSKLPLSLDSMLAAWNESDPSRIRGHLDAALSPDVVFADPDNYVVGIDAFEAMVHKFRADIESPKAERTSGFNVHNNRYRYNWLVSSGDTPLMPGMDVTEVDDNGKVVRVDGFFGDIPELGESK
ncbi:hypothetical protein NBRC116588_05550 [Pyruvatibacter sp. HU-CL02332]|uniref:nuclear transport factor 2 family protein n=1 Tax=Pyruvatibacter sp. HU-CL02332 TaxID=3127650 RepID=UPI0031033E5F